MYIKVFKQKTKLIRTRPTNPRISEVYLKTKIRAKKTVNQNILWFDSVFFSSQLSLVN